MQAAETAPTNGAAPHPAAASLSRAAEHLLAAAAALSGNGGPWGGRYDAMGKPDPIDEATEKIVGPALDAFAENELKDALDAFELRVAEKMAAQDARIKYLEALLGAQGKQ